MLRILRRMAGVCAALALVSANAATVTYSFTNPLSTTEINQTGSLSLFDSNLGTLTGASLTVTGNLESVVSFVNSASRNQRIRLISSSDVGLSSSLGAVHQLFNHSSDLSIAIDTGLQTLASGATYVSPLLTDQKILTANLNTALAALSAPGGGNFNLNCESLSSVSVSGGGGNVRYSQATKAGCGATITYTYDPAPPSIDLTIAKTVTSSGPYIVGSNVAYSLVARNLGPGVAQPAIVVKDLLPAGLTYVSATGTNWSCAAAGQTITCTRAAGAGTLASNASADAITVTAKVAAGATGSLVNLAQVNPAANETLVESNPLGAGNNGYETGDPATGSNNDASATIAVTDSIDLTIAKTVTSSGPYIVGSNVTYSLLARNLGPGVAQPAIVVKDLLPTGLTYVSATGTNWSCAAAGPTITCTRAAGASTLAANASADAITVTAKVATGATGSLVNVAQVNPAGNETVPESSPLGTATGGYEDGNPASGSNNDASATVAVTDRIDLTLTKTVTSTGPYIVGSNVTYSLLARNLGLGTAQAAIVVKDLLPAGLTYVSATGTNWSCAAAGPTITCTRAAGASTLAANASADAITVTAKVATGATGSLVNVAQVNPAGNETVPESSPLGTATGGYEDGNPASGSNNDDSKAIVVAAAAAIPTLNEWMLLLLSVMLGLLAMRQAQGRRHMK